MAPHVVDLDGCADAPRLFQFARVALSFAGDMVDQLNDGAPVDDRALRNTIMLAHASLGGILEQASGHEPE